MLNKIIRYTSAGIELEADPRHAELVIRELGLEDAKSSKVPGAKVSGKPTGIDDKTSNDESEELGVEDARKYKSVAARLNYLAVDRLDIQYAVKEAARAMSAPLKAHWHMLDKIGRYLIGRPRLVMKFPWQKKTEVITAYTDSDWAGCPKTSKSTSGGIVCIGSHVIKTYSRQQKVIALSSAEAELYAMVAASAECLAIAAYAKDLGSALGGEVCIGAGPEGEVHTDSSAAFGIARRCGIGKVRHLRTQALWVQETNLAGRLSYHNVLGTDNPADVLTKHVPAELLCKHVDAMSAEFRGGRAEAAPELNSMTVELVQRRLTQKQKKDGEEPEGHRRDQRSGQEERHGNGEGGGSDGLSTNPRRFCEFEGVRGMFATNAVHPYQSEPAHMTPKAALTQARSPGGAELQSRVSWADMEDNFCNYSDLSCWQAGRRGFQVTRMPGQSREGGALDNGTPSSFPRASSRHSGHRARGVRD